MRTQALLIVATLALPACATGTSSGSFSADRITRTEIEEAGPSSAYDLIQKLRPMWLRWRGSTSFTQETDVKVYLDSTPMGSARRSARSARRTSRPSSTSTRGGRPTDSLPGTSKGRY